MPHDLGAPRIRGREYVPLPLNLAFVVWTLLANRIKGESQSASSQPEPYGACAFPPALLRLCHRHKKAAHTWANSWEPEEDGIPTSRACYPSPPSLNQLALLSRHQPDCRRMRRINPY